MYFKNEKKYKHYDKWLVGFWVFCHGKKWRKTIDAFWVFVMDKNESSNIYINPGVNVIQRPMFNVSCIQYLYCMPTSHIITYLLMPRYVIVLMYMYIFSLSLCVCVFFLCMCMDLPLYIRFMVNVNFCLYTPKALIKCITLIAGLLRLP